MRCDFLLIAFFFVFSNVSQGQSNGMKPGNEFKKTNFSEERVIGEWNGKIFSCTYRNGMEAGEDYYYDLSVYDQHLERERKTALILANCPRKFRHFSMQNGQLFAISTFDHKSDNKLDVYLDVIDLNTLQKVNYRIIATFPHEDRCYTHFTYLEKPNKEKVLFADLCPIGGKNRTFGICFLDTVYRYNSLHRFTVPYSKKDLDVQEPYLLENGALCLPATFNIFRDEKKKFGETVQPKVFILDTIRGVFELEIPENDRAQGVFIEVIDSNKLACHQVIVKRNSTSIAGIETYIFTPDGTSIIAHKKNYFGGYLSERDAEVFDPNTLDYRKSELYADKNFLYIAPRLHIEKVSDFGNKRIFALQGYYRRFDEYEGIVNGSWSRQYRWKHFFQNVTFICADNTGEIIWKVEVSKSSSHTSMNENTYAHFRDYSYYINANRLYFLDIAYTLKGIYTVDLISGEAKTESTISNSTEWQFEATPPYWSESARSIYGFQVNDKKRRLIKKVY